MDDTDRLADTPSKCITSPIKQLPFSPSQFLNSPNLSFDVTLASTPVKHCNMQATTPQKDRTKAVSVMDFYLKSGS